MTDRYKKLLFNQDSDGTTRIVGIWHRDILMSPEMFSHGSLVSVTEEGLVKITTYNGWAVYKLAKVQPGAMYGVALERVEYHDIRR